MHGEPDEPVRARDLVAAMGDHAPSRRGRAQVRAEIETFLRNTEGRVPTDAEVSALKTRLHEHLGLDAAKLKTCIDSGKGAQEVAADLGKGNAVGVQGTPTFFINGRQHAGAPSVDALSEAIEAELN